MFAGPNGSGKSTLKAVLPEALLGVYLNPDEIERQIQRQRFLEFGSYGITATEQEVLRFFRVSNFLISTGHSRALERLGFAQGRLVFEELAVDSYIASVAVDFLRQKLLEQKSSLTLETVMSHPSKVSLLQEAQNMGYRTYLYYIATDDPAINVSRVRYRVEKEGGHPVPEDKIISRYYRSLELLIDAIQWTNRAYIFDNSGDNREHIWIAEITDGKILELKADQVPAWFKRAVIEKISG